MQVRKGVANIAGAENCTTRCWEVLGWSQSAIDVYEAIGAEFLEDWRLMMLRGELLRELAEQGR